MEMEMNESPMKEIENYSTSDTRSSISEEFGGSHLLQPSDPLLQTAFGEDFVRTIDASRPRLDSQTEIETWRVDPSRLYCYAKQALRYVQEMKGEEYMYFGPRSMCLCSLPNSEYKMTHINFFARRRGEKSESLMFAALEHGPVRKVVECCSVPLFKANDDVSNIKHPPHVDCSECSKFGDAALCFEEEEEPCCLSWSDPLWSSA